MSVTDIHLRAARLLGTAAWLLACGGQLAHAQSPTTITDADIERARATQPLVTDQDIERVQRRHVAPPHATPSAGRITIDALPQPSTQAPLDLEALARSLQAPTDALQSVQGLASGAGLIVFVSLSMPRPTLERLLEQAARARASVVIRGFSGGSLRATVGQLQDLIGQRQVAVQIDPQAFDRFTVQRVPSFVLVRAGAAAQSCAAGSCAAAQDYLRTTGDVSLDHALEWMQRRMPRFHKDAAGFLHRLRGQG